MSNHLYWIGLWARLWGIFLLYGLRWKDKAHRGRCDNLSSILGCKRKQTEQTLGSSQSAMIFHGSCFSPCLQVPPLSSCLGFLQCWTVFLLSPHLLSSFSPVTTTNSKLGYYANSLLIFLIFRYYSLFWL